MSDIALVRPLIEALDGERFSAILCDPPWYFKTWGAKGTGGALSPIIIL
jgi:hypothetical protein